MTYYVSYIREYPIYEPAEGGYYYPGKSVELCREFSEWRKANRFYQKLRRWFLERHDDEPERIIDIVHGGIGTYTHPFVRYSTRYIGEGEFVQMTKEQPYDQGRKFYC